MNPLRWLCSLVGPRTDDTEVHELADRVADLEEAESDRDDRLSAVEVRVGIRDPRRWKNQRDAG